MSETQPWPVLRHYDQDHLARIALPLGGIGTGTVSLGGRGDLRDWEIVNRPAKGFTPERTFFALWAKPEGGEVVTRALEGPLEYGQYEGAMGSPAPNHGLPRFRQCRFEAAYPLGQVVLSDSEIPVTARLQAFNPLIPADTERSSLPVAVLRWVLTNETDLPVEVAVCGNLQNFIGFDGLYGKPAQNVNEFRTEDSFCGLFLRSEGVDPEAEQWGTIALTALGQADVSYRTAWPQLSWGSTLLDFWDDFSDDGRLEQRASDNTSPTVSLAARLTLPPHGEESVTFLLTWHFPNRQSWTPNGAGVWLTDGRCANGPPTVGNYYTTRFSDAWDVARSVAPQLPQLETDTLAFVHAFCDCDLPDVVQEAALFNLSTLRSQTCFRTPDGRFYGWEGTGDHEGSCYGSCTHVWNYEQATAFLFGDLARSMREIEFAQATADNGRMSFRVSLPLSQPQSWAVAAADGQMGCLMKLYRDWQLSGDDDLLRSLWPHAKRSLEFSWIPGGWDADKDGVMEGCQHNTMDVEYYGPNPQMGLWYLGALRASEEMARYQGEDDFAAVCHDLFEHGSKWLDANLFNGDYYEHQVWPPKDASAVAADLRHESMGAKDLSDPELQLGSGCLVDQLVGQYMAHICGLGYLADPEHIQTTLHSLKRYNFKTDLSSHFNPMRTFALQEESAMLMATYPKGRRPKHPFPYAYEVMTGFEYTAAVGMLYEGQTEDGLQVIQAIRDRYDGLKRSPFDEAECGHHYARAMASWAGVLALTGFHYSAVTQTLRFARSASPSCWFWSSGSAWGLFTQQPGEKSATVELSVLAGTLTLKRLKLAGVGISELPILHTLAAGQNLSCTIR